MRRLLDDSVSIDRAYREINANRPTPQVTIEAVLVAVREHGVKALTEPVNQGRLARCDAAAVAEINRRIAMKYSEINPELAAALMTAKQKAVPPPQGSATIVQLQPATRSETQSETGFFSAMDLDAMSFDPLKFVIPGLIVEGLTLFCGKPKIGKSWLLLHAAIAIARGGFTLGELKCIEGDVLCCALEDSKRRLRSRMKKLLGGEVNKAPPRLTFRTEMPRLAQGGLEIISNWIKGATSPRLVVIDTLAMVRMPNRKDQSTYDADYDTLVSLRSLANQYGVAIVVVHHLRKAESDDPFDTISGTLGLTGCPDSIVVLKRDAAGAQLLARGRDIEEMEKAVTFHKESCVWAIDGDAAEVRRSAERGAIIEAIREAGTPLGAAAIASITRMRPGNVQALLRKMAADSTLQKLGRGEYACPSQGAKS